MKQHFNLVDEGWIPIAGGAPQSLRAVFGQDSPRELGGTTIQKLSILKVLLAIAQRAFTPLNDEEWSSLDASSLGEQCQQYLSTNYGCFWLYGEKPFLQVPQLLELVDAKGVRPSAVVIGRNYLPDLVSENDSVLTQLQQEYTLSDAEKAIYIISLMNYSPGGKRISKNLPPLTTDYVGKTNSAKSGPSIGNYVGYLNSCLWGNSILETVWMNLLTQKDFSALYPGFSLDTLTPPWEQMPDGEDNTVANRIKEGPMGTFCAMSRFVLLQDEGIIYAEGIQYPSFKQGWREPFIAYSQEGKVLWLDMSKKPWRDLTSLLALSFHSSGSAMYCPQITLALNRVGQAPVHRFGVFSGGMKVRSQAGDQSVKQTDDFLESIVYFDTNLMKESWFLSLEQEMKNLEEIASYTKKAVQRYWISMGEGPKDARPKSEKSSEYFWSLCEGEFNNLIVACEASDEVLTIRKVFVGFGLQSYDLYCPNESAKQMVQWANCRPNLWKQMEM